MHFTQLRSFVDETLRKQFKKNVENVIFVILRSRKTVAAKPNERSFLCAQLKNKHIFPVTSSLQNPESTSRLSHWREGAEEFHRGHTNSGSCCHYSSWSHKHISALLKEISWEDPDSQKHPKKTPPYSTPPPRNSVPCVSTTNRDK